MKQDKKKQTLLQNPKNQSKGPKQQVTQKLPDDMESEIRDCFNFYDPSRTGFINRQNMRSILGNFGFINKTVKDIEEEIRDVVEETRDSFSLKDVIQLISRKWFENKGRDDEIDEIYELFVRKDRKVGLTEIKNVFAQYLDIQISDADILEFIQDASKDKDGLTKEDIAAKMGYI
ncbi:unnamed protein product (macronuclear) [Paramecium tetraurelia]|uniref:EF-hand domain-containing protein n=1 Tax=Paramecium tetraurelia TaxID=5888 RepID=A0EHU0_PARTE|nr:uncharacterized protein GSPATT00027208001 [Paramecium tetraurelia]CAK94881.1 unnamed protein product [Paramecium tetraurelia]|eukprot:XP_001462254.1 hypothetical protein (macronuclear) [Paramecium tetraurelia strain d4-2]